MIAILCYIMLVSAILLSQEPAKIVHVSEHEEIDLIIQKHYYFELLPSDVKYLLKNFVLGGPNVIYTSHFPLDFLDAAFQHNEVDLIKCLAFVVSSSRLDALFSQYAFNEYCCCKYRNSVDLARLYLEWGGDPNKVLSSYLPHKPLFMAVRSNSEAVVKLLLDAGAQVTKECEIPECEYTRNDPYDSSHKSKNKASEYIHNSLYRAIENYNSVIVRMLLQKGANPHERIWYKSKVGSCADMDVWIKNPVSKDLLELCKKKWGNSPPHQEVLELVEKWALKTVS